MGMVQSVPFSTRQHSSDTGSKQQLWTEIGAALPGVGTAMAFESGIRIVWLQWHVLTLNSEIYALPHDFIIFLMGKVG